MRKIFYTAIAAITLTLSAKAAVITQTVDFGTVTGNKQLYFNSFNTALGTLTNVSLSWTANSQITTAQITNQNGGTVDVNSISFLSTFKGYVPSIAKAGDLIANDSKSNQVTTPGGSLLLSNNQSYSVNNVLFATFTQSNNYTSANANFNSFKGNQSLGLYLTNKFSATPDAEGSGSVNTWLTSFTGSSTGNLAVAYTYTAAPITPVPEPQSVALGLVGLLFVGGLGMRSFSTKKPSGLLQ